MSYGVQPNYNCHYHGACYGEICIDPSSCRKKWKDLTKQEKAHIIKFNKEVQGIEGEPTGWKGRWYD